MYRLASNRHELRHGHCRRSQRCGWLGRFIGRGFYSYEMLILNHEMFAVVDRFLEGIRVDEDTLALDDIAAEGPGGSFLRRDSTLRFLRSGEHVYPQLFNRSRGGKTALQKAHETVDEIVRKHTPQVANGVAEELLAYVKDKASSEKSIQLLDRGTVQLAVREGMAHCPGHGISAGFRVAAPRRSRNLWTPLPR